MWETQAQTAGPKITQPPQPSVALVSVWLPTLLSSVMSGIQPVGPGTFHYFSSCVSPWTETQLSRFSARRQRSSWEIINPTRHVPGRYSFIRTKSWEKVDLAKRISFPVKPQPTSSDLEVYLGHGYVYVDYIEGTFHWLQSRMHVMPWHHRLDYTASSSVKFVDLTCKYKIYLCNSWNNF